MTFFSSNIYRTLIKDDNMEVFQGQFTGAYGLTNGSFPFLPSPACGCSEGCLSVPGSPRRDLSRTCVVYCSGQWGFFFSIKNGQVVM